MNSEDQIQTSRLLQKRVKNTENAKKYFSIRVPQHISRILADIDSSNQTTLENTLLAYCSFFSHDVVLFNLYGKFGYDKNTRKFTRPVHKTEFIEEIAKEYGIEFILKNEKDEHKENTAPGEDMFEGLKEELSRTFFEKGLDVFSDPLDLGFNNNSNAQSSRPQDKQGSVQSNVLFPRDLEASLLSNEELLNDYDEKNDKDLGMSRGSWIYSPNISLSKICDSVLINNDMKIGSGGNTDLSFACKFSASKKQNSEKEKNYNLIDEISKIKEKILGKDKNGGVFEPSQSASQSIFRKTSMESRREQDSGLLNGYRGYNDVEKTPQKQPGMHEGIYSTPLSRGKKFDEYSDVNTPRSSRGLRRLSKTVKDMVNTKKRASYKEIADEVIRESTGCEHTYLMDTPMSVQQTPSTPNSSYTGKSDYSSKKTEKNIRRRVYDALNVLVAADVIGKDGKMVIEKKDRAESEKLIALNGNLRVFQEKNAKLQTIEANINETANNIEEKKKYLGGLIQKSIALKNLMTRNSQMRMRKTTKEEELIYFPCIVVSTPDNPDNAITLKTNSTRTQMNICFKRDIKMHGDADILLKLGLQDVPKEKAERWLENKDLIRFMPSSYI